MLTMIAAVSTLATTPASAIDWDWGPYYTVDAKPHGATMYFEERGDILKVCDTESDSKHAIAYVNMGTQDLDEMYTLTDWHNDGKCSYARASDGSWYNLPENRWYSLTICRAYNDTGDTQFSSCSKYYRIYNDH
ncbi:hypothetical protein [Streptomyces sp. NPDC005209]|uniref:hypothetical protein n=1 Tax=Streptomyces sp. NPDC005209 TaxID=3156715 RepID=UPI0033B1CEC5